MTTNGHLARWALRGWALLLIGALTVHFGMTLLFLTPLNPVKLRLFPMINSYMFPLFGQRWELFAPDPQTPNRYLMVQCRVRDPDGSSNESPWLDITTPLFETRYKHRITPADRILRVHSAVSAALVGQRSAQDLLLNKALKDDRNYLQKQYDTRLSEVHEGVDVSNRMASAECDRQYGPGRTSEVRVKMLTVPLPPYSERDKAIDGQKADVIALDWAPHVNVSLE